VETETDSWQQSAVSAISSRPDPFVRASARLAAFFVAAIALLLLVVSFALYFSFTANIRSNVEGNFATERAQNAFVARTVDHMRAEILLVDGAVLVLVSGAGFLLARRTLRPIQRNLEAQKRFVSNASHDLRTPLAVIKANLEIAQRYGAQADDRDVAVSSSLEEVDRMGRMVEDMLTLSRIDARQEELRFSVVDLSQLLARIVEKMQPLAAGEAVRLDLVADADLNALCDADHVERALVNVVRNAVQHSPSGSTVEIGATRAHDRVEVAIHDRGPGIDGDDLPHVFEPYYRAGEARSPGRGNSGLGLAITWWIVEQHGGTIDVSSAPGLGTAVMVSLPLAGAS
jgi:signal transduction histidine kinase